MLAILLVLAAAGSPTARFALAHPESQRVASAGGQLIHASGFSVDTGRTRPEDAARAFLASSGEAFGVTSRHGLRLVAASPAGEVGAVRFSRTIDGLPIFGGDLTVGVDALGRVFLVNAAEVPPAVSGRHALGEDAAVHAAIASFGGRLRRPSPVTVATGYRAAGDSVRAVYRVDFTGADWRVYVDGETGAELFRQRRRWHATAPGKIYEVSPVETAQGFCPMSMSGGRSFCAQPKTVTFERLLDASTLSGTQASAYNCKGLDAPGTAPGPCAEVYASWGGFEFTADSSFVALDDDFAAAMAYFHIDKHVNFFKHLDPTLPSGDSARIALRDALPALVNARDDGDYYENAYFSGGLRAMVFGQGAHADYAYDATVIYHELTHGVVHAWGDYDETADAMGGLAEPGGVNEGTADAMAVSETGRSQLGSFIYSVEEPAAPFMREMNDPAGTRTCQGDGSTSERFKGYVALNGLDGEVHDDGEIWNGFYWEVFDGLRTVGVTACNGSCDAAPLIQYKTIQAAAGTPVTFDNYWRTFKAVASEVFADPRVGEYVQCVADRRQFSQCNRTAGLYAGESRVQYVELRWSPFQVVAHANGPAQLRLCSKGGSASTVYARNGQAVDAYHPTTGAIAIEMSQRCSDGTVPLNLPSAGDWYLLIHSDAAYWGNDPGYDIFRSDAPSAGMAARPFATAPPTCQPPPPPHPLVLPGTATTPPRGTIAFTAIGGGGSGYTWSLANNSSGGSIDAATGVYVAGPTGSTFDTVRVMDSTGDSGLRDVTVTAGISIGESPGSLPPRGSIEFKASGGSGEGYHWSLSTNGSGGSIDPDSGAYTTGSTGSTTDQVQVVDSLGNTATHAVSVTAGVTITPGSISISPKATQVFTAAGGSGTGFAWSLAASPSGGSIDGTGKYTAGATSGVTDRVQVVDSLGNQAIATVAVGGGGGCSTSNGAAVPPLALLLAAFLLLRRRP